MIIVDALKKFGKYLPSKSRTEPITTIVIHATAGGSFSGAWSTLLNRELSYHAIIPDEDDKNHGDIINCVRDSRVAFHAGNSYGPKEEAKNLSRRQNNKREFIVKTSVNSYSLSISFVNMNDGKDTYSVEQHQACVERCLSWAKAYPSIEWITTHALISPGRKSDPKNYGLEKLVREVNALLPSDRKPLKIWKPK
jgi:N-acetyl-anhydromuramyl-L-alanine amidase AmpD